MPYINQTRRTFADYSPYSEPDNPGELNYVLTKVCLGYLSNKENPSYGNYNAVIGALECCKLEMYRRAIAPYEDKKIEENGDVY